MLLRNRYISVILICASLVALTFGTAWATDNQTLPAPTEDFRVDRTDFPVLHLATPCLQGEAVWMVQARLRELGYDIEPNGIFDLATSELVKMFQIANSFEPNGTVTQQVWEKLMEGETDQACLTAAQSGSKVRIEIDVVKHRLTLYQDDQVVKQYPVGVGKSSTPSPLGEWKVIQKSLNWGNGFGTRWMGLSVPWGIYGIHGTNKPYSVGQSLSHGCIRMRNKDVEELYPQVPMGTPVKIVENGQIFPKNFSGPTLKYKAYGQNVVYLQSRLKEKGIIFDSADGRYGKMTELAVRYYQVWNGLPVTGIADHATYRSLGMMK